MKEYGIFEVQLKKKETKTRKWLEYIYGTVIWVSEETLYT